MTGLPHLAKRIAEQYAEADYWNLCASERDYLAKLDVLRYRILIAHAKQELMQRRLAQLEDETSRISRLFEMGEVDLSDRQIASQRLNDTVKAQQEMDKEHLELHQELLNLLGLHPAVGDLELQGVLPTGVPSLVSEPAPEELIAHPVIKSLLAGYGASEDELRSEIRKQYPEISLSPGYAKEDGNEKFSLGFEMSLPMWNRNREAIARSQGIAP